MSGVGDAHGDQGVGCSWGENVSRFDFRGA